MARGECRWECEASPLVRSIGRLLRGRRTLDAGTRSAICTLACSVDPVANRVRLGREPLPNPAVAPASLAGCLCGTSAGEGGGGAGAGREGRMGAGGRGDGRTWQEVSVRAARRRGLDGRGAWADCGCRGSGLQLGSRTLLSMDATPMLHRLPAAWRMAALLPRPAAARFLAILRSPAERAISHLGMLTELSNRGRSP